ncbi:CHC2 zinc finger domain-containing protein, partial [Thermococcus sp.]|uniref:CHC2 zinc finger domain-containing protein n=1 Tax=Thermococcus sp. TaxID=35749 RepID=UPI002633CA51
MSFFNPFANNQSDQLDIRDIADNLENVAKSGDKFRATCPICGSKSARPFILFPNGGYYCHSCTQKGSVFSLIKDVLNLDFSNFKDIFKNFNPFYKKDNVSKNETPNFKYQQKKFFKPIANNRERIFKLLYELIPEETKDIKHKKNNRFIGYDDKNDTLAISLIDEDNNVVNIKRRKVGDIKWLGLKGGDGKFSPYRLTGKKFVYIASGIAEFLILNASELDYIVMQ